MISYPGSLLELCSQPYVRGATCSLVGGLLVGVGLVVSLLFLGVPAALGTGGVTVYVDAGSGSDGRSLVEAQGAGTPWKTVDHAIGLVPAGSTIVALSGAFELNAQGVSFDPAVIVAGEPGTSIVASFDGSSGLTVSGFYFPEYTEIIGSSSIVIKSGESEGGFGIGSSSSYVTLSGMYIHNVDDPNAPPWEKAVALGGSSGQVSNITISGNRFSNNPEDSIQINWARDVTITSNRFTNNGPWNATVVRSEARHSDVVQILGGENITFVNNTVTGNANVLMLKPHFGRVINNIVLRGNRFETNQGYALNSRNVTGTVTAESNTYICNGVAFKATCEDIHQYDITAQGTPNLIRINDPANTNEPPPATTTTTPPAATTTTTPPAATTTTVTAPTTTTSPPTTTTTPTTTPTTITTRGAAVGDVGPNVPNVVSPSSGPSVMMVFSVAFILVIVLSLAGMHIVRRQKG